MRARLTQPITLNEDNIEDEDQEPFHHETGTYIDIELYNADEDRIEYTLEEEDHQHTYWLEDAFPYVDAYFEVLPPTPITQEAAQRCGEQWKSYFTFGTLQDWVNAAKETNGNYQESVRWVRLKGLQ